MKIRTNIIKIASALGVAGLMVANSSAQTNQSLVGTATIAAGTYGNVTFTSGGSTSMEVLSPVTVSGTIVSEGLQSSKITGTGNRTVETITQPSSSTRLTNSSIIELAGFNPKWKSLGVIDGTPYIVEKVGKSTFVTEISSILTFTPAAPEVTTSNSTRIGNGKDPSVIASSTRTFDVLWNASLVGLFNTVGLAKGNSVYNSKVGDYVTSYSYSFVSTSTNTIGAPAIGNYTLTSNNSVVYSNYANVPVNIGQGLGNFFSITPSADNTALASPVWSATGLPKGLSIDSATGIISGNVTSGIVGSFAPVQVTLKTSRGSATINFVFSLQLVN